MRRLIKWIVSVFLGGVLLAIAGGVAGEFFTELARENGWYDEPSQKLDSFVTALSNLTANTWFLVTSGTVIGLTAGLWADTVLRQFEKQPETKLAEQPGTEPDKTGQLLHKILERLMGDLQVLSAYQWSPEEQLFKGRLAAARMRVLQSLPCFNETRELQESWSCPNQWCSLIGGHRRISDRVGLLTPT